VVNYHTQWLRSIQSRGTLTHSKVNADQAHQIALRFNLLAGGIMALGASLLSEDLWCFFLSMVHGFGLTWFKLGL
jgi:hypothetical protein